MHMLIATPIALPCTRRAPMATPMCMRYLRRVHAAHQPLAHPQVRRLLNAGGRAAVNVPTEKTGITSLIYAASEGHAASVQVRSRRPPGWWTPLTV